MIRKHKTNKPITSPTYNKQWSGVSYGPHSKYTCPDCGERLHKESDSYYCPKCDDFKGIK
jgi:ribosomal protein L37AE/L43A